MILLFWCFRFAEQMIYISTIKFVKLFQNSYKKDAKNEIQGIRKVHTSDLFVFNMVNWVDHGGNPQNTICVKKNKLFQRNS